MSDREPASGRRSAAAPMAPSREAGRLQPIGPVERFPPGRWRMVSVRGREIGVFNTGQRWYAVRNKCPHEGARLCLQPLSGTMLPSAPRRFRYGMHDRVLTCPWHGWQFDVESGEMLFGSGDRVLSTYEVLLDGGMLYLDPVPRRARAAGGAQPALRGAADGGRVAP